ncbi:MAG: type II toxin-antitoxin system RelE/ParE family toxin [Gaiella sp.]
MPTVVLTPTAVADLDRLILTHSLSADTRTRLARSLRPLEEFPLLGAQLEGEWSQFRFLLGPWRWMLLVYTYDETADRVAVVTIQDGRSSRAAATTGRA